jgi:hypothetical protein
MNTRQHFVNKGDHYDLSAAAAFLMLAIYAFAPDEGQSPRLQGHVNIILTIASNVGFAKKDLFHTMLTSGETGARVLAIAEEVTQHVGGDAVMLGMIRDINQKGAAQ